MFRDWLWQTEQVIGISVVVALAVLDGVVERGEKLESPLDSRIVISNVADAFKRFEIREDTILRTLEVASKAFDGQTMPPASKSSRVKSLSESRVERLI